MRRVDESIWVREARQRFRTLQLGTRMAVVRLRDGALWVWNPVPPTPELRRELDALGPVAHVVAPNLFHHLNLRTFADAYPDACYWAVPGLAEKRPELRVDAWLGDEPPPRWQGQIDQVWMRESEPVREVVFFHRASSSLLSADLLFNVGREAGPWTRLALRLLGAFGRVAVVPDVARGLRGAGAAEQLARVRAWPMRRLIPAHGALAEGEVAARIDAALAARGLG